MTMSSLPVASLIMSVSSTGLMYLNFSVFLSIYVACNRLIAIIKLAAACCDGKKSRN